jgi:hypothetical protein
MNGIAIELPRTADGRHADFAPALALAASKALAEPPILGPELRPGTPEFDAARWDAMDKYLEERAAGNGEDWLATGEEEWDLSWGDRLAVAMARRGNR